jgi:hypothetical protein
MQSFLPLMKGEIKEGVGDLPTLPQPSLHKGGESTHRIFFRADAKSCAVTFFGYS